MSRCGQTLEVSLARLNDLPPLEVLTRHAPVDRVRGQGAQLNPASIFECFIAYQKTAAMQAADIGLFSAIGAGATKVPDIASAFIVSK